MKTLKKGLSTLLALGLLLGLTACGGVPTPPASTPVAATPALVTETPPAAGHYPVTITTYNFVGDEITTTYEKAPEKVIAIYQGSIETMLALGLEDRVVASYGLDNEVKDQWKAGFAKMHYDETVFVPDKETVLLLQPDMIFAWGSIFGEKKLGDVDFWMEKQINPYMNTNTRPGGHVRTLENEYTDLLNLGKIFNVEDRAQALVDEMRNEIKGVLETTSGLAKEPVCILEFQGESIVNYGADQLVGDMALQLGGELVAPAVKTLGKEDLVAADPAIIFVVYMAYSGDDPATAAQENLDKVLKDPALASLTAGKNGRVYPIMLGDMYASTVRTIDGIRTLEQGLYPSINTK